MVRWFCLGDSNTFGYDPHSPFGGRYAADIRWTGRLSGPERHILNGGVNGLSISRESLHEVFADEIRAAGPDLVLIMLGSNDLLMGLSAGETAAAMEKLLRKLIGLIGPEKLLLIAPPPFQRGLWAEDEAVIAQSHLLGAEYRKLAESLGIAFADAAAWDIPLSYDGVHFTEEGHRRFAGALSRLKS